MSSQSFFALQNDVADRARKLSSYYRTIYRGRFKLSDYHRPRLRLRRSLKSSTSTFSCNSKNCICTSASLTDYRSTYIRWRCCCCCHRCYSRVGAGSWCGCPARFNRCVETLMLRSLVLKEGVGIPNFFATKLTPIRRCRRRCRRRCSCSCSYRCSPIYTTGSTVGTTSTCSCKVIATAIMIIDVAVFIICRSTGVEWCIVLLLRFSW